MEKRIVILGAGESGSGAAILAKKLGFDVFVSDFGKIADRYKEQLDSRGILWEEQQHTEESSRYGDRKSMVQQNTCRRQKAQGIQSGDSSALFSLVTHD